jgi:hypothetical protein
MRLAVTFLTLDVGFEKYGQTDGQVCPDCFAHRAQRGYFSLPFPA